MRIYLAGPMRGIEKDNHPAFDMATDMLRLLGHVVSNPAEHDRANGTPTGEMDGRKLKAQILWDLGCIADADAVVLLPGWINSTGVRLELEMARFIGCEVLTFVEMVNRGAA